MKMPKHQRSFRLFRERVKTSRGQMTKDKEEVAELGRTNSKAVSALHTLLGDGPTALPLAANFATRPILPSSSRPCNEQAEAESAEEALADAFGLAGVDISKFRSPGAAGGGEMTRPTMKPMAQAVAPAPATQEEEEDIDEEVITFVDVRLRDSAHEWPAHAPEPPATDAEALDADGPWGAVACGVEIRQCEEASDKGLGAFATRPIAKGTVVGIYWGEQLTQRSQALRHGWRTGAVASKPTRLEKRMAAARLERLATLKVGAPIRGAANGSSYSFSLFSDDVKAALGSTMLPRRVAYIDGEDPNLSSWCRYINHACCGSPRCNLQPKCDALRCLVWFEALEAIACGDELNFDYGDSYEWDFPPDADAKALALGKMGGFKP